MPVYTELQPIFNKVWHEFVELDAPQAMNNRPDPIVNACEYRTAEGARCFIGVCIPKDMYMPALEGSNITMIANRFAGWYSDLFNGIDDSVLKSLQSIHDSYIDDDGDWKEIITKGLRAFAERHGLTIPEAA